MTNLNIDTACASLLDILNSTLKEKNEVDEIVRNRLLERYQSILKDESLSKKERHFSKKIRYWFMTEIVPMHHPGATKEEINQFTKEIELKEYSDKVDEFINELIVLPKDLPFAQGHTKIVLGLDGGYVLKLEKNSLDALFGDKPSSNVEIPKIIAEHYICSPFHYMRWRDTCTDVFHLSQTEHALKKSGFKEYIVPSESRELVFDKRYRLENSDGNIMFYQDLRFGDTFEIVKFNEPSAWLDIKNRDEINETYKQLQKRILCTNTTWQYSTKQHDLIEQSFFIQVDKNTGIGKLYLGDINFYIDPAWVHE